MEFQNEVKEPYLATKESLRIKFNEAVEFLDHLESMEDQSFHVGTDKNLHLYYKDRFLFSVSKKSRNSIELSGIFNSKIKPGTKSDAESFIALLLLKLRSAAPTFKRPLENLKNDGNTIAISQSAYAPEFFDMVLKVLRMMKRKYN